VENTNRVGNCSAVATVPDICRVVSRMPGASGPDWWECRKTSALQQRKRKACGDEYIL